MNAGNRAPRRRETAATGPVAPQGAPSLGGRCLVGNIRRRSFI